MEGGGGGGYVTAVDHKKREGGPRVLLGVAVSCNDARFMRTVQRISRESREGGRELQITTNQHQESSFAFFADRKDEK